MEIHKFKALIPLKDYLRQHTLMAGDIICINALINLQNITNGMVVAVSPMEEISVLDSTIEGLTILSTTPVDTEVRSITSFKHWDTVSIYVKKVCCLVSDIPVKTVSQLDLFADEESIPH